MSEPGEGVCPLDYTPGDSLFGFLGNLRLYHALCALRVAGQLPSCQWLEIIPQHRALQLRPDHHHRRQCWREPLYVL